MKIYLYKLSNGTLAPNDNQAIEYLNSLKSNQVVSCSISKPRNYGFHRKFFALLQVAYDAWNAPDIEYNGQPIHKNFERFRHDVTILAGYYDASVNLKGEVRLDAKSISFAQMNQDEFEKLYSSVIDVILRKILTHYTRSDLDYQVEKILNFS